MVFVLASCKKIVVGDVFLEADELVAKDPAELADVPLRVHGYVKRGSIKSTVRDTKPSLAFIVTNKDKGIDVVYAGPAPDKFQDQAEVVVRGTLAPNGTMIIATEVLAKCPTNYDRNKGPQPTYP